MHLIRNRVVALLLGAAAITGFTLPAAAQAAPAEQSSPAAISSDMGAQSVSIDIFTKAVDVSGKLVDIVTQAIAHNQNREGYVKSLMEGAFYDARQQYNVMVIKVEHSYTANLDNVVFDANVSGSGYPTFKVLVFSSGTFTNHGDGGWINWAFRGWFDRNGMTVHFHRP